MTNEMKVKMFEKVLELDRNAQNHPNNNTCFARAYGAYEMLIILGLEKEFSQWLTLRNK